MVLSNLDGAALEAVKARFAAKVNVADGDQCWLWNAATNNQGYGVIRVGGRKDGKLLLAHRVAYFLAHPGADDSLDVLHSCDTPRCCNARHLSQGSHVENMADMVSKGRHAHGVRNGQSKLDPDKVRIIRAGGLTDREFAHQFGVARQVVNKAKNRKTWVNV